MCDDMSLGDAQAPHAGALAGAGPGERWALPRSLGCPSTVVRPPSWAVSPKPGRELGGLRASGGEQGLVMGLSERLGSCVSCAQDAEFRGLCYGTF